MEESVGCVTLIVIWNRERGSLLLYLDNDVEERVGFLTLIVMWKIDLVALL